MRNPTLLLALVGLAACTGTQDVPPPGGTSPTPPAGAGTPIRQRLPPLPAPGEGGVYPHHGGLVAAAGDGNLELVVAGGRARLYPYDGGGAPLSPATAAGTLTVDGKEHPLVRTMDGGTVVLEGGESLPAFFDGQVRVELDGKVYETTIRHATAGLAGSSRTEAAAATAAAAAAVSPAPARSPAPSPGG